MQCTYGDIFSTSQNSFRSHRFWCVFMFLPFFGFTSSTSAKHFPMRTFFILGNKEKSPGRRSGESVGRSMRVMMFLVKNCWTLSEVWAGALINYSAWNGQMLETVFKKNSLKPDAASHNTTSWYTDTDRFLEHSAGGERLYYKGPDLQKIIPIVWPGGRGFAWYPSFDCFWFVFSFYFRSWKKISNGITFIYFLFYGF